MADKLRDGNKVISSSSVSSVTQSYHSEEDFVPSEHVRILVRCRPLIHEKEEDASPFVNVDPHNNWIDIKSSTTAAKRYKFCCVADETTDQANIFEQTGQPMVECVLTGFNAAIVAYGQTGSGKTYTMQGTALASPARKNEPAVKGIIQMVCELIFNRILETEKSGKDKIFVQSSYLEIYNETLIDLLAAEDSSKKNGKQNVSFGPVVSSSQRLAIREDTSGSISVVGLSTFDVTAPEQCYQLLRLGADRRKVAATNMNAESSRSHAVFTLTVSRRCLVSGTVRVSRLHLVDLAGSERQRATGASGMRLREAGGINKSLSALGNVINALSSRDNLCFPRKSAMSPRLPSCRESKLTFLLKDALGGSSKLCLIAAISPALGSIEETVSTLEFAKRCSALQNEAVVNDVLSSDVSELQEEVRRLQVSLRSAHIGLSNSKSTMAELRRKVNAFQSIPVKSLQRGGQCDQAFARVNFGTQTDLEGDSPTNDVTKRTLESDLNSSTKIGANADRFTAPRVEEKESNQKNSLREDQSRAMDIEGMRIKWLEMIQTNQGLWEALIKREEEILELKMAKEDVVKEDGQKMLKEEIEILKRRVEQNPELVILRHRLEAYRRNTPEENGEAQNSLSLSENKDLEIIKEFQKENTEQNKLSQSGSLLSRDDVLKTESEPSDIIRVRKSVSFKGNSGIVDQNKTDEKRAKGSKTSGIRKLHDDACQNYEEKILDSEVKDSMTLKRTVTRTNDCSEKTVISDEMVASEIEKNITNMPSSVVQPKVFENGSRLESESNGGGRISSSTGTGQEKREMKQREHKRWTLEEKQETNLGVPTRLKNKEGISRLKREEGKDVASKGFADDQSWIRRRVQHLSESGSSLGRNKNGSVGGSGKTSAIPSKTAAKKIATRFDV